MKKITFNDLPAGSIVLVKKYSLWKRFKAWLKKEQLKYNDAWVDPLGNSGFSFKDSLWTKHNVFTFVPIKKYSKKEKIMLFEDVLVPSMFTGDPVETILMINTVRPNTFKGATLEELLDDNKYYTKREVK